MPISKLVTIIITNTLLFSASFGQKQTIENLKRMLPILKDSARVDSLNDLSEQYAGLPWWFAEYPGKTQLDSSEILNSEAFREAKEINYLYGIGKALAVKAALAYDKYEDYKQEEKLGREAIYYYKKANNKKGLYKAYWRMGQALYSLSRFDESIKYLDTCYILSKEDGDSFYTLASTTVSANDYSDMGNYEGTIEKLQRLHTLRSINIDPQWKSFEMDKLGELYDGIEDYSTAINYYKLGLADSLTLVMEFAKNKQFDSARRYFTHFVPDTSTQRDLRFYLTNAGEYYLMLSSPDKALPNFLRSLKYNKQFQDINQTMRVLIDISKTHFALLNQDSAFKYAEEALGVAKQAGANQVIRDAYKIIFSLYDFWGRPDSAYYYYKQYIILNDSINNKKVKGKLAVYGFEQKIELLNNEKEIQQIRLQNQFFQKNIFIAGAVTLLLIVFLLWRNNSHKQKAYLLLQKQKQEIDIQKAKAEQALLELKSTQSQLIHTEKMASLGELTAGIAHEIQNPLNFVNNFSEVNKELVDEMQQELKAGKIDDAIAISNSIKDNEDKIIHHGKRADSIVKGMLQHSRSSTGKKEPTNINALADEYLRLSFHGLRAKEKEFNATMNTDFDQTIGNINIIPQDIGRVLLNLYNNAFYAVTEKKKMNMENYEPIISVSTKKIGDKVEVRVKDNGNGISQKVVDKIFQPFFTTKPTGQGTGLGLSLSYDIIKTHGGEIKVETKEGEGSEFIILIPVK